MLLDAGRAAVQLRGGQARFPRAFDTIHRVITWRQATIARGTPPKCVM